MTKERILLVEGKEVEVSEEVYKAYMQPIWREEKRTQRAYKSLEEQEKDECIRTQRDKLGQYSQTGSFESGFNCGKQIGLPLSLERANEESGFEPISEFDVEGMARFTLLKESLLMVLSEFSNRDKEIMELHLIYEMTEREIANVVNVSQKTVNNVKKKLLPIIQEKMRPWKDSYSR